MAKNFSQEQDGIGVVSVDAANDLEHAYLQLLSQA